MRPRAPPLVASRHVTPPSPTCPSSPAGRCARCTTSACGRRRAPAADGRQRSHLDLRRGPPDADPRQGQGADRAVGVLVRQDRPDRRQPPDLRDRRRARGGARAGAGRAQAARCCRSSASCAATSPARAGRTTRRRAPSPGSSCPPGLQESERLPEPIFTPSTKAEVGHDEAIDFERAAELVGDRALMERVRDVSIELYSFAAEHAPRARRDPRRHQVRVRPRRRRRAGRSATRC